MMRALKGRVSALEAAAVAAGLQSGDGDTGAADRAHAIAQAVRILLQSDAWPDGLADLLHRMEDAAMSEEDTQLGERIAAALKVTDLTTVDFVRQVFDMDTTV